MEKKKILSTLKAEHKHRPSLHCAHLVERLSQLTKHTMSWEFRFFLPIDSILILSPLLTRLFSTTTTTADAIHDTSSHPHSVLQELLGQPPKRTDDYVVLTHVNSVTCGIKVRGGKWTECKLRKGCVPSSNESLEKWKKIDRLTKCQLGTSEWTESMSTFLWTEGALPLGIPPQISSVVTMSKNRKATIFQHTSVTFDLLNCGVREGGEGGSGATSVWVSLSLEGDVIRVQQAMRDLGVLGLLRSHVAASGTCVFGGYPRFAAHLSSSSGGGAKDEDEKEKEKQEEEEEERTKE